MYLAHVSASHNIRHLVKSAGSSTHGRRLRRADVDTNYIVREEESERERERSGARGEG